MGSANTQNFRFGFDLTNWTIPLLVCQAIECRDIAAIFNFWVKRNDRTLP
jgi:hypothetical protein